MPSRPAATRGSWPGSCRASSRAASTWAAPKGMQQYNLEVFGSADSQKSFSHRRAQDQLARRCRRRRRCRYHGFEMYEEYNMQTASGTAESDVAGIYMNMVTKSGSNRFASDNNFYFMNDALQGDNVDDELRQRMGLAPGAKTGAAGNPVDLSYDWSSTLGGPVKRDKVWFFGAIRRWRLDQFQIGALNPDGSQAIDDNRIENYMGKGTWQIDSAHEDVLPVQPQPQIPVPSP